MQACSAHTVLLARDCPPVATVDRNYGNRRHIWVNTEQDDTTMPNMWLSVAWLPSGVKGSKALRRSARGVTTDPGSIPGCITTGHDREPHRAAHNWPSVVLVRVWPG